MILSIIVILAGALTILFLLYTKWCTHLYDFWIAILVFLVCFIISLIFVNLTIYLLTLTINKKKKYTEKSKFWRLTVKYYCQFLIQILRIDINFRGLENIPDDKTFVLVQNHNSLFDPVITIWLLRYLDIVFLMKKEIDKVPFLSHALYRLDFPALDRNNNREGLKTIIKTTKMIEEGKHSVGVYPEGTRSKDGKIHEFKAGSFKIPERCGCPIVVTVLKGTDKLMKNFPFKKTNVYFDCIACIDSKDYQGENTPELSDTVYKMMVERLDELNEMEKE